MTASSPVTMEDLVNGLIFTTDSGVEWPVVETYYSHFLYNDSRMNEVTLSSDGLTITFGEVPSGPTFTGFTFNA